MLRCASVPVGAELCAFILGAEYDFGFFDVKTESLGIRIVQSASMHCSVSFQLDTQPSVADKAFFS